MADDKERKESLFIVAYKGTDTAEKVYDTLHDLQKKKELKIKTAMVIHRKDNGKLKLVHKHRIETWGGAAIGGGVALLLGAVAAPAVLAGAVVGGALGGLGHTDRKDVKEFLDDKLGPDDSAVAILIKDADWKALEDAVKQYDGKDLKVELTADAQKKLSDLGADPEVADAAADDVEQEDEPADKS